MCPNGLNRHLASRLPFSMIFTIVSHSDQRLHLTPLCPHPCPADTFPTIAFLSWRGCTSMGSGYGLPNSRKDCIGSSFSGFPHQPPVVSGTFPLFLKKKKQLFNRIGNKWYPRCVTCCLEWIASRAYPMAQLVKNPPAVWETCLIPGLGRSPRAGNGDPLQYSGEFSPWGRKESDTTEWLPLWCS